MKKKHTLFETRRASNLSCPFFFPCYFSRFPHRRNVVKQAELETHLRLESCCGCGHCGPALV